MNELQVLELQLESNGMKIEILNLRQQLSQAIMPTVQRERDELIAKYQAAKAKAEAEAKE